MRERLLAAVEGALDALEREALDAVAPDFGDVCAALLPGYCDFRWLDRDWRQGRPRLAAFAAAMEKRASFVATSHRVASGHS